MKLGEAISSSISRAGEALKPSQRMLNIIGAVSIAAMAAIGCGDKYFVQLRDGGPDGGNQDDAALVDGGDAGDPDGGDGGTPDPDAGDSGLPADAEVDAEVPVEDCTTNIDEDGNGLAGCADTQNCTGEACGPECECGADGYPHQTVCTPGSDGDGDGLSGCADNFDCNGEICDATGGCTCDNGIQTETGCGDSVDNDGDGFIDRVDADCNTPSSCEVPCTSVGNTCLSGCGGDCLIGICDETLTCFPEDATNCQ